VLLLLDYWFIISFYVQFWEKPMKRDFFAFWSKKLFHFSRKERRMCPHGHKPAFFISGKTAKETL